jgi:hypothetical protein
MLLSCYGLYCKEIWGCWWVSWVIDRMVHVRYMVLCKSRFARRLHPRGLELSTSIMRIRQCIDSLHLCLHQTLNCLTRSHSHLQGPDRLEDSGTACELDVCRLQAGMVIAFAYIKQFQEPCTQWTVEIAEFAKCFYVVRRQRRLPGIEKQYLSGLLTQVMSTSKPGHDFRAVGAVGEAHFTVRWPNAFKEAMPYATEKPQTKQQKTQSRLGR